MKDDVPIVRTHVAATKRSKRNLIRRSGGLNRPFMSGRERRKRDSDAAGWRCNPLAGSRRWARLRSTRCLLSHVLDHERHSRAGQPLVRQGPRSFVRRRRYRTRASRVRASSLTQKNEIRRIALRERRLDDRANGLLDIFRTSIARFGSKGRFVKDHIALRSDRDGERRRFSAFELSSPEPDGNVLASSRLLVRASSRAPSRSSQRGYATRSS